MRGIRGFAPPGCPGYAFVERDFRDSNLRRMPGNSVNLFPPRRCARFLVSGSCVSAGFGLFGGGGPRAQCAVHPRLFDRKAVLSDQSIQRGP